MKTQEQVVASLPFHLRPFVATQDYDAYTPRDQAIWRFLMSQLVDNLKDSAHPVYLEGLERTGIDTQSIPKIEIMNNCLEKLGWRAAVVDGFIPPAIFIEFLAHRVLVVAVDIRSIEHMLYTPAPDIIHESAGHAPFLIDVDYGEYLERVGRLGRRVITNKSDIEIFEAMRSVSIIKESCIATSVDISSAEKHLANTIEKYKNDEPSESTLLSRLQWWTTEYGLVGDVDNYKIYGAGLLSSLGESVNCLNDDDVKKQVLTIDAISTNYDITQEQPQLFVAKSCRHLSQVAQEFARNMCYFNGGANALRVAIKSQTVNTAVFNSGLEVSGVFTDVRLDAMGNTTYINTSGPTQLAYEEVEIVGQGTAHHPHGFGSPVGRLQQMDRCLSKYSVDDLKRFGIEVKHWVCLEFLSGISVSGELQTIYRRAGRNLIFTFDSCTVLTLDGEVLFDPTWGVFDMAVGDQVNAVYGGSADLSTFPQYTLPETLSSDQPKEDDTLHPPTVSCNVSSSDESLFNFYQNVRTLRETTQCDIQQLTELIEGYLNSSVNEWLLDYELCELAMHSGLNNLFISQLKDNLMNKQAEEEGQTRQLIQYSLNKLDSISVP